MTLKERSVKSGWGKDPANWSDSDGAIAPIEFSDDELSALAPLPSLQIPLLAPAEFLADEVYLEIQQAFEAKQQALREAQAQARRAQMPVAPKQVQAPAPAAKPAPPPAPKPRTRNTQIQSDSFNGDKYP